LKGGKLLFSNSESKESTILINKKNEIILIPISEIVFIEKEANCIVIHTEKELFKTISTLLLIEQYLDNRFLKVHKCYIVNIDYVHKLIKLGNRSYKIEFKSTIKYAYISRYKYNEVKNKFGRFL
jgi:two-component system LytT family response regulator